MLDILLLNQARISAIEDLKKILEEKEGLQTEICRLQSEIAEVVTLNKLSPEKKMEMVDEPGLNAEVLSLKEELHTLRRENKLLTDEIGILQKKLSDVKSIDAGVFLTKEGNDSDSIRGNLEAECKDLREKLENLQILLDNMKHEKLHLEIERLQSSPREENDTRISLEVSQKQNELLQHKVESLEERLRISDEEIDAQIELYQTSVKEFHETLDSLKEESKKRSTRGKKNDMPWNFWSRMLLTLDGWFLEKKINFDEATLLREMARKRDSQIQDAFIACKDKSEHEAINILLNLTSPLKRSASLNSIKMRLNHYLYLSFDLYGVIFFYSSGLHIVHIAAEMAPVAKVN